ncbi:MAG: class I SAM-dependent methyltransferase [Acetobacteraceae bacterium]|nr:class I SAM-dependent methyltransferase [Acetobacteraceae bacterium]
METERLVARHYERGGLLDAILRALVAAGKDPDRLAPDDLTAAEEFHTGGRQATADLAARMGLSPGMRLLDIGCGVGGPARYFARAHGCRVTGIDLTEEYVRVAADLTRRVGLDGPVSFLRGSALALPFPEGAFGGAYMLHVGMNVADKAALFAGVRRVLKPGAVFAVYDVMRLGPGALDFPLPWASEAGASFVAEPAAYRDALRAAGFAVEAERDRRDFALDALRRQQAQAARAGFPALGTHLLMGEDYPRKIANQTASVERGLISPVEIVARAA